MFGRVKAFFANITGVATGSTQIANGKSIVQNIVGNWNELSKFESMTKTEIYAQFMTMEPEIAAAIDRYGTLAASAYKGVYVKHGNKLDDNEIKMLDAAKQLEETMHIKDQFEAISEMLMGQGNCYIIPNKDGSITYLPPEYVTIIENNTQLGTMSSITIMTQPNILVLNERGLMELDRKTYPKGKYIHIKYKETPFVITDNLGRRTFGFYSVSPLERTIMNVWWKRQITTLDVLWRYRNLPRDHHKIKADVYSLDKYSGADWATKRSKAKMDADSFISTYTAAIASQAPDQGYVSLDTVNIERIGGNSANLGTNELLKQIEDHIWTALNIAPSTVNGTGAGSYASELVISNYVSGKVVQLAGKAKPVLLDLMRKRLLEIDSSFPVAELDMKLELTMAASQMENVRQMTLMASVPIFTENELREQVGKEPLADEQRDSIVVTKSGATTGQAEKQEDLDNPDYPNTPETDAGQTRDASQNKLRSDEKSNVIQSK